MTGERIQYMQMDVGKNGKEERCFEDLAELWLANARMRVKESSYVKYGNLLRRHILPEFGAETPDGITTERMERFIHKFDQVGLSGKSVRDILAVVRSVCQYAEDIGYSIPCRFSLIRLRERECRGEVRILSREEREVFEHYLLEDESLIKTGILISLYMGLRLGEVCALRREHIIYEENVICVRHTMQRIQDPDEPGNRKTKVIITNPKSSSSIRDIPAPQFLMDRLRVLETLPGSVYVLTGKSDKYVEPRTMENALKRYLQECKMDGITYHALRHTFATRCIESGFDVKTLSEILGHANANVTLNRYVHSSMERKRENMKKLITAEPGRSIAN